MGYQTFDMIADCTRQDELLGKKTWGIVRIGMDGREIYGMDCCALLGFVQRLGRVYLDRTRSGRGDLIDELVPMEEARDMGQTPEREAV